MNSKTLNFVSKAIRKAGAHPLTKIRTTLGFDILSFPQKNDAALAVTHRHSVGTLAALKTVIEKAGFVVCGSTSTYNSHIVFFNITNHQTKE